MEWRNVLAGSLVMVGAMVAYPAMADTTLGHEPHEASLRSSIREDQSDVSTVVGGRANSAALPSLTIDEVTTHPANAITCSTPTIADGGVLDGLIIADTPSADRTRLFAKGNPFDMSFVTNAPAPDIVAWSIKDHLGNIRGSGAFAVASGVKTSRLSCTAAIAGYFSVNASLERAGGSLPRAGTRPAGIAAFGVLPDLSGVLSPVTFAALDQHRFGMQGFNFNGPVLTKLGIRQTIDNRQLSYTEPKGPNTWSPPPLSALGSLYKSGQLLRLVRLDGIPAWASPIGRETLGYAPMASQMSYFQSYMARVGRETEVIRQTYYPALQHNYYQLTWEPSIHWMDSTANFVAMYEAAYKGLHSADPHAIVMGTTDFPAHCPWCVSRTFQDFGIARYIDGVTTHAYWDFHYDPKHPPELNDTNPDPAKSSQALDHQMQTLRQQMQLAKPNMRLWSTELGVSYDEDAAYGPNLPTANQLYAQAAVATRAHLIVLGEGAQVTYFFYGADYPSQVGFGTFFDNDHPSGSYVATNLSPKPEALSFAALTRVIDGTRTLGRLNNLPAMVHGYSFERMGTGQVVTALWTHNNAQWPTTDGIYSPTYSAIYALTVDSAEKSGELTVLDMMGNPTVVPYSNGVVVLKLTESPIYVISSNVDTMKIHVTVPVGYTGQ